MESAYCVCTATLVAPRTVPPASLNWTKMRLVCGTNGTAPLAVANIAKVGVALALIVVETLGPTEEVHWPLAGSVWHRLMLSGNVTPPVVAEAVIGPPAPTLTVAGDPFGDHSQRAIALALIFEPVLVHQDGVGLSAPRPQ
jgi:hypothetical protein